MTSDNRSGRRRHPAVLDHGGSRIRIGLEQFAKRGGRLLGAGQSRDLVGRVMAMPAEGVDLGRFEQADPVVVPQRLDVQVGRPGEVADREC
jgi:hypothetical protein